MKIGMFAVNMGVLADPDAIVKVARHAEACGVESLWTGEHVVLPDPQVSPSPLPPDTAILDPAVALTLAASVTEKIKLATGIIILPQRNPVVLAKELASVDVVSKGRFIFGIGIGYLEPEFRALGVPFERKGARAEQYLAAMRSLWQDAAPAYDGEYVRFSGLQQHPRPAQRRIPVVFGGHSRSAYRRAVTLADGWYGFAQDHAQTEKCLADLRAVAAQAERPREFGELEITITPPIGAMPSAADLERYASIGVDRVVPMPFVAAVDDYLRAIDRVLEAA